MARKVSTARPTGRSTDSAYFFGRDYTRVEVWTDNGLVYPHPTGKVSAELEKACSDMRGRRLTFHEVFTGLKDLL